ncbi:hypothetical protein DRP98_08585 [candidate division KSB1 bacterium]|nr:MAG: hypothetical protein DRQ12_07430 [candidate division KSB1 bacterium]RKY82762.1 MAG: hypothetical protein DRP98_08585 [candidate division KSB1 bacterium]HDI51221.1 efflux RND transporter periplasmic adaptor subunit [Bacteroidota bacterium]
MRRTIIFFLTIVILTALVSSCSRNDSSGEEAETAIPVKIMTVALGNVVQSLNYNGDVEAEYEVKVFSKIPDRIEKFFVDEGDRIAKGAPIAQILATTIEQAVTQAEANLAAVKAREANLRLEYERAQRLFRENAMSKRQFDGISAQYEATKAQVRQVQAALASARTQLNDATVTAPIAGIIGNKYYQAGDMAMPTLPLVSIVKMERVKITFDATEEDLGKLAIGQNAVVRVKSYPGLSFEGEVIKISPVLDPVTHMAKVEVLVNNSAHKLKPGMYAQVEVTTGVIRNVIVVPRHVTIENTSLERVNGKDKVIKNYYVFVVKNNQAEQRKLNVQYVNHESIAVDSGIKVGEKLVIAGQNNLRDGITVSIVEEEGD